MTSSLDLRTRAVVAATTLAALAAAIGLPASAGPLDPVPTIRPISTQTAMRSYATLNADGSAGPAKSWFISRGSGNGNENYLVSTSTGLLVNVGGGVRVSTDRGVRWSQVISARPGSGENEGAVVGAPGGDIVAVEWGAFNADRLQSYKYTAADHTWKTAEVPLHSPFFDRPWIGVIPGPFTLSSGQQVPYISILRGGTGSKDLWLTSTDGLNYETAGNAGLEAQYLGSATSGPLPVTASADLDWIQGHPASLVTPLASGGLAFGPGCLVARTDTDASWNCMSAPNEIGRADRVLVDSRGWIHAFVLQSSYVLYSVSTDGGQTWDADAQVFPGGLRAASYDVKVSAAAGKTALAVHGQGTGTDQDFVLRWDNTPAKPSFLGTWLLGQGNLDFGGDITSTGPRFDFQSLTFLPDGKIAVSFGDAEYPSVSIAIEP